MKHTIVLLALVLTACGSSSNSKQAATAVTGPTFKRALVLLDPMSQNVASYLNVPGWSVDPVYVDGLVPYTTLDGTVLAGATPQLPALLNGQGYDAVIVVVGGYEYLHDRNQYAHQSPSYYNAHAGAFVSALDATNFNGQVMWVHSKYTASNGVFVDAATTGVINVEVPGASDDPQVIANAIVGAF